MEVLEDGGGVADEEDFVVTGGVGASDGGGGGEGGAVFLNIFHGSGELDGGNGKADIGGGFSEVGLEANEKVDREDGEVDGGYQNLGRIMVPQVKLSTNTSHLYLL